MSLARGPERKPAGERKIAKNRTNHTSDARAATRAATMGQCNLLIDRHVHKNGGTTLRHIFQSMPSQCRYYGGWRGLVHKTWLQILNDTVGDASGQARWACIEAHYPLMEDLLPQIRLARHMASCRAVLILRCARAARSTGTGEDA